MSTLKTTWPEDVLLDAFWRSAADLSVDRLQLLRLYSMVVVERPESWDRAKIRGDFQQRPGELSIGCFSCFSRSRPRQLHHVLQIQHGGSNSPRNLVTICHDLSESSKAASCHQTLHLWMRPSVSSHETTHTVLDSVVAALSEALMRPWGS